MTVMSSLRDSDPLSDSFGAQESCQEKVSRCAPLTTFHEAAHLPHVQHRSIGCRQPLEVGVLCMST